MYFEVGIRFGFKCSALIQMLVMIVVIMKSIHSSPFLNINDQFFKTHSFI